MRIFPENFTTFEQKIIGSKPGRDFCETDSDASGLRTARVPNPKACGVQGCSPGGGCGGKAPNQIFFRRMKNTFQIILRKKNVQSFFCVRVFFYTVGFLYRWKKTGVFAPRVSFIRMVFVRMAFYTGGFCPVTISMFIIHSTFSSS